MAKLVVAKWIIDAIVEGIKTAPLFASLTDGFALRSETYPSVLLLILLEFGLVLLLDALKLLNRLVEAAILRKKVYRFIINELERVSPQTPYALCRAPRVMWDEFAEDFAKHGQTPDYYVCNCGPTSAPGHELLLRKVAAVDMGQLARGQGAGEKGRKGEGMSG